MRIARRTEGLHDALAANCIETSKGRRKRRRCAMATTGQDFHSGITKADVITRLEDANHGADE